MGFQAGFCRLDITPPLGVRIGGYYYERIADGVLDPLYVNALAFSDGEHCGVVLVCDLLGIYNDEARTWAGEIARKTGLASDAVFLCHIHTHTGPVVCGSREPSDEQYDAWLFRRLCDAVVLALQDRKPVTAIRAFEGLCPGVAFVRRFKMKSGIYQTWANYLDPDIESYAGTPDESLRFVRIEREGGEELVLVNFQLHPDNVNGTRYSADFPGFLRRNIEQKKENVRCVFLNGAEGQMVAADWWHDSIPRVPYQKAIWIAERMAEMILEHYDDAQPVPTGAVSVGQTVLQCRTKRDPSRIPEAERLIAMHEAGRDDDIGPDWIATPLVAEAYILRRLEAARQDEVPIMVSAVTLGDVALLGIGGEPFCELGQMIRRDSPYPVTMVCCQTNGCEGYYPTSEAYDQGGYEPRNTRFVKGVGETISEAAAELLKRLHT